MRNLPALQPNAALYFTMRLIAIALVTIVWLLPSNAFSYTNWRYKVPHPELLPEYTRIIEGEVVAIDLVDYEKEREARIGREHEDIIEVVDATPTFKIEFL